MHTRVFVLQRLSQITTPQSLSTDGSAPEQWLKTKISQGLVQCIPRLSISVRLQVSFQRLNNNFIEMAYVQQVCDGYNKKTLMGNWYEERLYPKQPFREQITKAARNKDEGITCFDNTGFQRALPRLQRRNKWQTANRIILNDGYDQGTTVMKSEYPHFQQQSSLKEMKKPFDKNSAKVTGTSIHPHSEVKPVQKPYHMLNEQLKDERQVLMYGSDFRSTLPQHPAQQKYTSYVSEFKAKFASQEETNPRNRTQSQFTKNQMPAGNYRQVQLEQTVKPITTMFCENKKQQGDQKEKTGIQRSWVPQKDKALSFSMGRTAEDFKKEGLPKNDIQTSLNMNIGVHNLQPVGVPDNYFRHVRSITIQNNKTFCSRP